VRAQTHPLVMVQATSSWKPQLHPQQMQAVRTQTKLVLRQGIRSWRAQLSVQPEQSWNTEHVMLRVLKRF
jgi:hypothetical protein